MDAAIAAEMRSNDNFFGGEDLRCVKVPPKTATKERIRKPGPRAKQCPWCDQPNCRHCHCMGFPCCSHKPGEMCTRERYKRRLVCNPCEKHKLNFKKSQLGIPVVTKKKKKKAPTKTKKKKKEKSEQIRVSSESTSRNADDSLAIYFSDDDAVDGDLPDPIDDVLGGLGLNTASSTTDGSNGGDRFPSLDLEDLHDLLEDFDQSSSRSFEPELVLRSPHEEKQLLHMRSRKRQADDSAAEKESEPSRLLLRKKDGSDLENSSYERNDILHLNVKFNPEAFGLIPVNRELDNLAYVRRYIQDRLIHELDHRRFTFLSREGVEIKREQESELTAWDQSTARDWTHHTFGDVVRRFHLFVVVEAKEDGQQPKRRRFRPDDKDDGEDDDDDEGKKDNEIFDLFRESSQEVQEKLAWEFFSKFHGNVDTKGREHKMPLLCAAAASDDLFVVRKLLQLGANINAANAQGNTALHIASRRGNVKMLKLLLRAPVRSKTATMCGICDMSRVNKRGKTAYEIAKDDATRKILTNAAYAKRVFRYTTLPSGISPSSTLSLVRPILMKLTGCSDLRFSVQGTLLRPSQDNDFRFSQCDWNRIDQFVFAGEGGVDTVDLSTTAEKLPETAASKSSDDSAVIDASLLLKKLVVTRNSVSQKGLGSVVGSCPPTVSRRHFRPPEKIRRHIAMAASASPNLKSTSALMQRIGKDSQRVASESRYVEERRDVACETIPLRRTVSYPTPSSCSASSLSRGRHDGADSRRIRSARGRSLRRGGSAGDTGSSGSIFGIFRSLLCVSQDDDVIRT